ncbi:MAG: transposase, partial [Salinivirgaceae bacterium]
MNMTNSKYKNKYRIPSARLQTWDYGSNAAYFVTICTQNRTNYFGEIINQKMQLSELGQLANQFWIEIPNHFSFVNLGEFIIMPNHLHGIIIIDKNNDNGSIETSQNECNDDTSQNERNVQTPNLGVSIATTDYTTSNNDFNSSP